MFQKNKIIILIVALLGAAGAFFTAHSRHMQRDFPA